MLTGCAHATHTGVIKAKNIPRSEISVKQHFVYLYICLFQNIKLTVPKARCLVSNA